MSPMLRPFCCDVFGLIQMALSHVILFVGFGSSCSQPLLEKEPSQMVGSGRNTTSMPCGVLGWAAGGILAVTFAAGNAVLGTMPSLSAFCQKVSKFGTLTCPCQ